MKVILKINKPSDKKWTVKGKTMKKLFANLNKHKWWGRYRANPDKKIKEKDKKVSEFTLIAKPVITMPKWSNYTKASTEQKKSWDDMWTALKKHEDHHHTIMQDASDAWVKTMDGKGDLTKKEALKEYKQFLKDTQDKQDKYDADKDHGKKEGVMLVDC